MKALEKVLRVHIDKASVVGLTRLRCTFSLVFRFIPSILQLPAGVPHADENGRPSAETWIIAQAQPEELQQPFRP